MWRRLQCNLEQRMDVIFIAEIALSRNEYNKENVLFDGATRNSFIIVLFNTRFIVLVKCLG